MTKRRSTSIIQPKVGRSISFEAEVPQGLESLAWQELHSQFGKAVRLQKQGQGYVRFVYQGDLRRLWSLSLSQAIYHIQSYDVPRPKALLGDQHFRTLLAQIAYVRELSRHDEYQSVFVSAAGSESTVMRRLRAAIATSTGLIDSDEQGDLLIRVLPSLEDSTKWETLVRISPRPLATRDWRICNFEGALNATIARAMALLTRPNSDDCYVNLACGSGTLLIERLGWGGAGQVIGVDNDLAVLNCADVNIKAAGYIGQVNLIRGDGQAIPLMPACADALCADVPFGHLVGSHDDNLRLYPKLLEEAARIARHNAHFVVLTHEVRLMERLLKDRILWQVEQIVPITQRGLHPRIYVLRRNLTS